jgi:hypothetical protein
MKSRIIIILIAIWFTTSPLGRIGGAFAQWLNPPISVGPFDNYQISTNNGYLETTIAVNLRNPLNFVCTDNRLQYNSGAPKEVFYTTNGGVNWLAAIVDASNWDPWLAADSLGNFYLVRIQNGGNSVQLSKSTNGGISWTNLGNVINTAGADKCSVAADQTAGPYQNHVYIFYRNATASLDFWRSTNNGATWSFMAVMGPVNGIPAPVMTTGHDGRAIVAWYANAIPGIFVRVSTDGGATFGPAVTASIHTHPGTVNASGYPVLKTNVRVIGLPNLAVDMTYGACRGYMYLAYASNPAGPDAADVYLTRSTDGGATWSYASPVRINDDSTINDQFIPSVSVDGQGRVWTMWMDSREDSANNLIWTYGAVSTNGGESFMPNFKISSQSFDPAIVKIPVQPPYLYYLGDYQGLSGKNFTLPCYVGQNNTRQDFTAYLPDYGISFSKELDSISQGSSSDNVVRIPLMGPYSGTVTYTATVSPSPAPGTISFTWIPGNVKTINGVPDSLTLNTTVSSDVPLETYTVSATGTESSGPRTHTRSWTLVVRAPIGIVSNHNEIPQTFALYQNYPNPFNPVTKIKFDIPSAPLSFGEGLGVRLLIYDILGREIAALVNEELKPGTYEVDWNAANYPSGIYFYRITAGEFTQTRKMILLR